MAVTPRVRGRSALPARWRVSSLWRVVAATEQSLCEPSPRLRDAGSVRLGSGSLEDDVEGAQAIVFEPDLSLLVDVDSIYVGLGIVG